MNLPSYPKVWNFGHREVADILRAPVYVEEKVDGSQFSFGLTHDGQFVARSKGAEVTEDNLPALFKPAYELGRRLQDEGSLPNGWVYRGEAMCRPKHNILAYDRAPAGGFILFDVETEFEGDFLTPEEKLAEGQRLGLEVVPVLFTGLLSHEDFDRLLETTSVLGGQKIEGVVVKPVDTVFGKDGKALFAKHVSEGFKEVHRKDWKKDFGTGKGDIATRVTAGLVTEARWRKAVQHLRDSGTLTDSPKDIGPLLAEIARDTFEEEGDRIRAMLFKEYERQMQKLLTTGFPEWYKAQLVEKQFAPESAEEV